MSTSSRSYDDSETSSIQETYRIADSDSDEEINNKQNEVTSVKEIDELKELTKDLLDENWRITQNKRLLNKMLELEEPSISPKMVDFLLSEGTCELLLEFITQLGGRPRPYPHESDSLELKYSYRTTMLLSVDEPSDALLSFLSRRASIISRAMFEVFRDDSAGSFYHSARVIESLLRLFPSEVYDGLTSDGLAEERMARLLRYIGYPPVGDLIVILVALTPVPRASPLYTVSSTNRWKFFESLSRWLFLLKLTEIVVNPESICRLDEYVTCEQHCSAAAQTLQELIEKLCIEEIGEIVLQPLGYTQSLIDSLVDRGISQKQNITKESSSSSSTTSTLTISEQLEDETFLTSRRVSLRILSFLLKKSITAENICFVSGPSNTPVASLVPNRLYPLRPLMIQTLISRLKDIENSIIQTAKSDESNPTNPVNHPGHQCRRPFSSHRSQLIELFVLIIEGSDSIIEDLSYDLWKLLIQWNFEYAHNNIYHTMFYRLLFAILRQNNDKILKVIFKKAKLLTHLLNAFDSEDEHGNTISAQVETDTSNSYQLSPKDKKSLRGFVMNCCNAIRLQTSSLPPSSFLRSFVQSHQRWNLVLQTLRVATIKQQPSGLGFYVPSNDSGSRTISHLASLLASARDNSHENSIDHGSAYAKSLGFEMEMEWPIDEVDTKKDSKKQKNNNQFQNEDNQGNISGSDDETSPRSSDSNDEQEG